MRGFWPLGLIAGGAALAVLVYGIAVSGFLGGHWGVEATFAGVAIAWVLGVLAYAVGLWSVVLKLLEGPWPRGEAASPLDLGMILFAGPAGLLLTLLRRSRQGPPR